MAVRENSKSTKKLSEKQNYLIELRPNTLKGLERNLNTPDCFKR